MADTCANCRFSGQNPHPGAQPEGQYRSFLGLFNYYDPPSDIEIQTYNMKMYLYKDTLLCQRYPKPELVVRYYGCGEFVDRYREGVNNEKQEIR